MRAHALILDASHRAVFVDGAPFVVEVPAGTPALRAIQDAARTRLGRELDHPLGRHLEGDDSWFVFVDRTLEGELVPLRTWATCQPAWSLYVDAMLGGWDPPRRELEVCSFGDTPELAAKLAHLIVKGEKRGTTGWVAAETMSYVGMLTIVTDGFGIPLCAIETTRVDRAAFRDATAAIAAAEGEGDRSLEDWRAGHRRYFEGEGARIGVPFGDEAEMFYEYFRVLHVLRRDG